MSSFFLNTKARAEMQLQPLEDEGNFCFMNLSF